MCGCYVLKTRHAVSQNIRRHGPGRHTCFDCPGHPPVGKKRCISKHARKGWGSLINVVRSMGYNFTVVWEARVVPDWGPFDLWVYECNVLVEVDGEQHTCTAYNGVEPQAQARYDHDKSNAAVQSGYHVVRLHHADALEWKGTLALALTAAIRGTPPTVHLTRSFRTL